MSSLSVSRLGFRRREAGPAPIARPARRLGPAPIAHGSTAGLAEFEARRGGRGRQGRPEADPAASPRGSWLFHPRQEVVAMRSPSSSPASWACLGVVELEITQEVNYNTEIQNICSALRVNWLDKQLNKLWLPLQHFCASAKPTIWRTKVGQEWVGPKKDFLDQIQMDRLSISGNAVDMLELTLNLEKVM